MQAIEGGYSSDGFQRFLHEMQQRIDSELANLVSAISGLRLQPQIRYALLSRGKKLRPLLVILSTQCVGGDEGRVMPLAIALELIHTSTLVHDDIIDKEELRRGVLPLYRKWSVEDAILSGDAMIALAIGLAADFGAEIMRVVSQSALELCDGEYMDVHFSLGTATREEYFLEIKKKSASLFRDAAFCGALVGGGSRSEIESLSKYGENLGMAYQIRDDLLDLADFKKMPITLPTIHSYEMSDLKRRERLQKYLKLSVEGDFTSRQTASEKIRRMLTEDGSSAYCRRKIVEYVQESIASLAPFGNSFPKSSLVMMARSLVSQGNKC